MAGPAAPNPDPPAQASGWLTLWIVAAIVAAFVFAWAAPNAAAATAIGGEIFLNLLTLLAVPLVVTAAMSGVLGMGDVRKLGRPGAFTLAFFFATTAAAVLIGIAVVNVVRPGEGAAAGEARQASLSGGKKDKEKIRDAIAQAADVPPKAVAETFPALPRDEGPTGRSVSEGLLRMLFPKNLFAAAAAGDLLPLIAFSLFFAAVLTTLGPKVEDLRRLIVQTNEAFLAVVMVVMRIAPIGIFCLVASRFGQAAAGGPGELRGLFARTGWYMACVVIGLAIHSAVSLLLPLWLVTRRNPFAFVAQLAAPLLTAFSTASGLASLPVTIEAAVTKARISKRAVDFVLPLGAAVNTNGTALYEAVAALFIAQSVGMDLSLGQQAIVALTATVSAVGAAGIPEAGLVTLLVVLNAVGLPTEGIGLILAVDWLLDRFRTTVNVFGDVVGAAIIEGTLEAAPPPVTASRPTADG